MYRPLAERELEQRTETCLGIFAKMMVHPFYVSHFCGESHKGTVLKPLAAAAAIAGLDNNEESFPKFEKYLDKVLPPFSTKGEPTLPYHPKFLAALKTAQENVSEYIADLALETSARAIIEFGRAQLLREMTAGSGVQWSFWNTEHLIQAIQELGASSRLPKSDAAEAAHRKAQGEVSAAHEKANLILQITKGKDSYPAFHNNHRTQLPASELKNKTVEQLVKILADTNYLRVLVKGSTEDLKKLVKQNADVQRKAKEREKVEVPENERADAVHGLDYNPKLFNDPATGERFTAQGLKNLAIENLPLFKKLMAVNLPLCNKILRGE